jgi:hypothetical protein
LLGLYLGDGDKDNRTIRFAIPEGQLQDHYADKASKTFERTNKGHGILEAKKRKYIFSIHSKHAVETLNYLEMFGTALTKRVPSWIYDIDPLLQLAFLRGYLDSDGTVDKMGRITFASANKELINDIRVLCITCGIPVSNINEYHGIGNYGSINTYRFICGYPKYNRVIWSNDERYKKRLQHKSHGKRDGRYMIGTYRSDGLELPDGYGISRVLNCEYIGEEDVYDLSTNNSHTFIAEGIVVHNTAKQDEINFLTKTIVPDCQFIQSVLNEQLFNDLGLHWEFLPETLDALQTDEASRSTALSMITSAGVPLHVALAVLGFELTDEQWKEIEDAEKEKKARADQIANQTNQPKISKAEREKGQEEQTTADQQQTENQMMKADTTFRDELEKWRRKALNAMKKGKPANVDFASTVLPEPLCETIMTALGNAESEDDVKQIFDSNAMTTPKPEFSDGIMALANELKRANDLLEREE